MKAPAFRYCRPDTLEQALELLQRFGDGARLIAGGQSLLPSLSLRLSSPEVLIDINRLEVLRGIREIPGGLRIGALSRHQEVERSPLVQVCAPALSAAIQHVAHPPIRALGTFGGSLALADPAAEAPAITLLYGAVLLLGSAMGERRVHAADFFQGLYSTALAPGEVVLAAELPRGTPGERFVFREFARRSGDFATAGVALRASFDGARVSQARVVVFGVSDRPLLAQAAMQALTGQRLDAPGIERAVTALDVDITHPLGDLYHDEATKMHLLRVLLRRALAELAKGGPGA
jgi:carbon-monoxide dehydrogenase medium subunit